MITVIGAGTKAGDLTERGRAAVKAAKRVLSRRKTTVRSEVIGGGDAQDFNELNERIVAAVLAAERTHGDVVYVVPGDGYGDAAAERLIKAHGAAFIPGVAVSAGREPGSALVTLSAYDIGRRTYVDTALPLLIFDLDDRLIAGEIKLKLLDFYEPERVCTFSGGGGLGKIALSELDRQKSYAGGCLFLSGEPDFTKKSRFTLFDLIEVMRRLTDPDGCPWDRAQTHESIRINLIEEAYEAADALRTGDEDGTIEELGDVLLQVLFHCDIAERSGGYTLGDIVTRLTSKLITRHTHIFGTIKADNADEALLAWEAAKAKEKSYDSLSGQLERLPANFPATLTYQKAVKKGKKAGAGYSADSVLSALKAEANAAPDAARLLALSAAYASLVGLDPEIVLSDAASALKAKLAAAENADQLSGVDET